MDAGTLVREFCASWGTRDADAIAAYFTDDAVYHNMPLEPVRGRAAIRDFIAGFLSGFDSAEFRIAHLAATDDVVMTERTDVFTVGGRDAAIEVAGVFEVRDGRIAAWRDYFDLGRAMSAIEGRSGG